MSRQAKRVTRVEVLISVLGLCALQACAGRSIDLDQATIEISSDAGTAAAATLLTGGVLQIWVDDARLYWTSVSFQFQSCLKNDCAHSLTTYATGQVVHVAIAGGHVYFNMTNDDDTILSCPRAGCDGAPTRVVQDPSLGLMSADGDYVYWASALDIYRCLYSGCGPTPELVAAQQNPLFKLAFQGADAFWGDDGMSFADVPAILYAPKDGSASPATFFQTQTFSLAADAANLYWLETESGNTDSVKSCPLTGCAPKGPALLATSPARGQQLTVDASGMYWLDMITNSGDSAVRFCPIAGCGSQIQTLIPPGVIAFAVDDSYLYWSETDPHQSYAGKNIRRTAK
jgi:hypothetical protein